jgi:hypothetical protein
MISKTKRGEKKLTVLIDNQDLKNEKQINTGINSKIYVNCRFTLGLCNQLRRFNLGVFRQERSPQSATAYICGTLWATFFSMTIC